jgi:hypothetical protein
MLGLLGDESLAGRASGWLAEKSGTSILAKYAG